MKARQTAAGRGGRIVAAMLALAWIAAGLTAIALGLFRHHWVPLLLGSIAAGYGILWARVARTGRKLNGLWPKRRL